MEKGIANMKPPKSDRRTIKVRFGLAFLTAGSAVSKILIRSLSFA